MQPLQSVSSVAASLKWLQLISVFALEPLQCVSADALHCNGWSSLLQLQCNHSYAFLLLQLHCNGCCSGIGTVAMCFCSCCFIPIVAGNCCSCNATVGMTFCSCRFVATVAAHCCICNEAVAMHFCSFILILIVAAAASFKLLQLQLHSNCCSSIAAIAMQPI